MQRMKVWLKKGLVGCLCAAMLVQCVPVSAYAMEAVPETDIVLDEAEDAKREEAVDSEETTDIDKETVIIDDGAEVEEKDVDEAVIDSEAEIEETADTAENAEQQEDVEESVSADFVGVVPLVVETTEHCKAYATYNESENTYSDEITSAMDIDTGGETELYFVADEGYTVVRGPKLIYDTMNKGIGKVFRRFNADYSVCTVLIRPAKGEISGGLKITADAIPVGDITYTVDPTGTNIESAIVTPGDRAITLEGPNAITVKNNVRQTLTIVPKEHYVPYAYYKTDEEITNYEMIDYNAEKNAYTFDLGRFYVEDTVYMETQATHQVNFELKNGLKVRRIGTYEYYDDEETGRYFNYEINEGEELTDSPAAFETNKAVFFTVGAGTADSKYGKIVVKANGVEVPSVRAEDHENGETAFYVEIKEATTIVVELAGREIPVEYDAEAVEAVTLVGTKAGTAYNAEQKVLSYNDDDTVTGTITLKTGYNLKGIRNFYSVDGEERTVAIKTEQNENIVTFTWRLPYAKYAEGDDYVDDCASFISKMQIVTEKKPDEKEDNRKKLIFTYKEGILSSFKATLKGTELTPVKTTAEGMVVLEYLVDYNETVNYTAVATDSFKMSMMEVYDEFELEEVTINSEQYEGTVDMKANMTITFYAKAIVNALLTEVNGETRVDYPASTASTFAITGGKKYELRVLYGGEAVDFINMKANAGKYGSVNWDMANPKVITINPAVVDASGKAIRTGSISVSVVYTIKGVKQSTSYRFTTYPELEGISLNGLDIDAGNFAIINQQDSRAFGRAVMKPAKANLSLIGVETKYNEGYNADNLQVSWKAAANGTSWIVYVQSGANTPIGDAGTIKLYRTNLAPDDPNYYIKDVYTRDKDAEYKIVVTEPTKLTAGSVTAAVSHANDTTVTMNLTRPTSVKTCYSGKQYYECKVVPQVKEGENLPADIIGGTFYFERDLDAEAAYDEAMITAEVEEYPDYAQPVKLKLNASNDYKGRAWNYDVTVSMVQTADKTELTEANADTLIRYRSKPVFLKVSTKDPVYETNLKVKVTTAKVTTGQKDIKVADLGFSEKTICRDAFVSDVTECADDQKLNLTIKDEKVYVDVNANTLIGKHTVRVTPAGPSDMYQNYKDIAVTVVRGIEKLEVVTTSHRVLKLSTKAATMKASVIYNDNQTVPAKKNVVWSLVDEYGEKISDSSLSIKNGVVTIAKTRGDSAVGSFRIRVTANDYAGNTVSATSDEIFITETATEIGTVAAVSLGADNLYHVNNGPVVLTSSEWQNTRLVAFSKSVEVKTTYTSEELQEAVMTSDLYSVAAKNNKAVRVTANGTWVSVEALALINKTDVVFTTTDGGNQKKSISIGVKTIEPKEIGLARKIGVTELGQPGDSNVSFNGTVNTVVTLQLMNKMDDGSFRMLDGIMKHSVKVVGGTLLKSDAVKGVYDIVVGGQSATITVTDHAGSKKVYTVTNASYSAEKPAAIKVTGSLLTGTEKDQELTLSFPATFKPEGKKIAVEISKKASIKTADNCEILRNASPEMQKGVENDNFAILHFAGANLPIGNYKVDITVGTMKDGVFVAEMKPVTATLKVVKPKVIKGSYKVTKGIVLDKTAGSSAEIKGTGQKFSNVKMTGLKAGNDNGNSNRFLEFFELDSENGKLVLKKDLTKEQMDFIISLDGKTHCIGYVTYTYEHGDDGYGNKNVATATACIQVKFK